MFHQIWLVNACDVMCVLCTVPVRNVLSEIDCHFIFVIIYAMRQTQQETVIICVMVYKVHVERSIY